MARPEYAKTNQLGYPAPDWDAFGEMIVLMQEAAGTQNQLALLLGVDYETVGGWRKGRTLPRGPHLARMIREFPLLADDLILALAPGDTPGAAAIRMSIDLTAIAKRASLQHPTVRPHQDQ